MSAFRRIVRNSGVRSNKAPQGTLVDFGHPINKGLFDVWLCAEDNTGPIRPLVSPLRTLNAAVTNSAGTSLSPLGSARNFVAASTQIMTASSMPVLTPPFTGFAIARVAANASTYTVFSYQQTTGNNGVRMEFNNEQYRVVLGAVSNMNSTLSTGNTTWYALGVSLDKNGAGSTFTCYAAVLGNMPTINSEANDTMGGSPETFKIGGSQNNSGALGGDVAIVRFWDKRCLTQSDMRSVFADPLIGIVAPRRRFARPSGVAATFNPGWVSRTQTIGAVF